MATVRHRQNYHGGEVGLREPHTAQKGMLIFKGILENGSVIQIGGEIRSIFTESGIKKDISIGYRFVSFENGATNT